MMINWRKLEREFETPSNECVNDEPQRVQMT